MASQKDKISLLFSGGSDSTLTAALMARQYDEIHLHTYSHAFMFFETKCEKSLKQLRDKFGHEKFKHRYLNVRDLFNKIYFDDILNDLPKYGNYLLPNSCAACRLSMHVATVIYNLEHNIRFTCDGSQRESGMLFPEQMPGMLKTIAGFYSSFDMIYTTPVYDLEHTDWQLFDMGITPRKNYKNEHLYYSTQHSCFLGTLLYIYVLGFYVPFFGRQADENTTVRYITDKLDVSRTWVEEHTWKAGCQDCNRERVLEPERR